MRTDKRKRTARRSLQHGASEGGKLRAEGGRDHLRLLGPEEEEEVRRWEVACQLVTGGAIVTYQSATTVQEAKEQTKRELGTALKRITKARESACQREPDKTTLGGIIQAAREAAGMTLREAATKAGIAPSILSRIERDALAANPTLTNLRRVGDMLSKPLSSLFSEWESQNGDYPDQVSS